MEKAVRDLTSALGLEAREHIALVGGGGKTHLMFALAKELLGAEKRVLTSTTTKIWYREAMGSPCVALIRSDRSWREGLRKGLDEQGHAFLAQDLLDSGKVQGISAPLADELYQGGSMDYLILEADGSAQHPVKAPAEHEPVIPRSVTRVVAMMGLEVMGQPLGPQIVFRANLFGELLGLATGDPLTVAVLSRLVLEPHGMFKGAPPSGKRLVFLNKLDLLPEEQKARELSRSILSEGGGLIDRVVIGSIKEGIYHIIETN